MSDETFHLTPIDVRRYEFATAMRGYDKARVEQFREQVADEMERLTRLNAELDLKAKGYADQLRTFRERDKALNDALISAQQLRAEIREQAAREAQLILREARAESDRLIEASRNEIRRLEEEVGSLGKARRAYLTQLRLLVERQLAEIEAAESAATPQAPSPPNGADNVARTQHNTPAWLDSLMKE